MSTSNLNRLSKIVLSFVNSSIVLFSLNWNEISASTKISMTASNFSHRSGQRRYLGESSQNVVKHVIHDCKSFFENTGNSTSSQFLAMPSV